MTISWQKEATVTLHKKQCNQLSKTVLFSTGFIGDGRCMAFSYRTTEDYAGRSRKTEAQQKQQQKLAQGRLFHIVPAVRIPNLIDRSRRNSYASDWDSAQALSLSKMAAMASFIPSFSLLRCCKHHDSCDPEWNRSLCLVLWSTPRTQQQNVETNLLRKILLHTLLQVPNYSHVRPLHAFTIITAYGMQQRENGKHVERRS